VTILHFQTEMRKPASLVAAILFWLIALAQLLRVLLRVQVTAGGHDIPLWPSAVAFVVLGALGVALARKGSSRLTRGWPLH
jgi:hypothetical protein